MSKFIEEFPTKDSVDKASDQKIFKWYRYLRPSRTPEENKSFAKICERVSKYDDKAYE